MPAISLVVPLFNEEESIEQLIDTIFRQSLQPDEIILVDGGSEDKTVEIVLKIAEKRPQIKLVKTGRATPGSGRNIGVKSASNEWIALTDAGIELDVDWLAELAEVAQNEQSPDIVYGNVDPVLDTFFLKCAALAYVKAKTPFDIRTESIASALIKKTVWERVGGFPDLRAGEDLMFMEAVEKAGFKIAKAPKAMVHWNLRPDLKSTFQKFVLYSKHNVKAGRQWDWHYGILKQYALLVPFLLLAIFHSWWWLLVIPFWLMARTAKRMSKFSYEFGFTTLANPFVILGTAFLILVIDLATYTGWIQAVFDKK